MKRFNTLLVGMLIWQVYPLSRLNIAQAGCAIDCAAALAAEALYAGVQRRIHKILSWQRADVPSISVRLDELDWDTVQRCIGLV